MKLKGLATAMVAAVLLGVMGVPASAEESKVGILLGGIAGVGKTFTGVCDKFANTGVAGNGLHLPTVDGPKNGVWSLSTPVVSTNGGGDLFACGKLTKTNLPDPINGGNLGAACGASKGWDGHGKVYWDNKENNTQLFDLGWKTALGGVLPVIGKYKEQEPDPAPGVKGAKKEKGGTVVALILARGGADCLTPNGAKAFAVDGIFAAINGPELNWNQVPFHCKGANEAKDPIQADPCLYPAKKNP